MYAIRSYYEKDLLQLFFIHADSRQIAGQLLHPVDVSRLRMLGDEEEGLLHQGIDVDEGDLGLAGTAEIEQT